MFINKFGCFSFCYFLKFTLDSFFSSMYSFLLINLEIPYIIFILYGYFPLCFIPNHTYRYCYILFFENKIIFAQKYSVILKALLSCSSVLTSVPNLSQKRLIEYVTFLLSMIPTPGLPLPMKQLAHHLPPT